MIYERSLPQLNDPENPLSLTAAIEKRKVLLALIECKKFMGHQFPSNAEQVTLYKFAQMENFNELLSTMENIHYGN
jgi:hypothetical protein